jgi:hypothetical protein
MYAHTHTHLNSSSKPRCIRRLSNFFVTQPYMERGFTLVVRDGPAEPGLFAWSEPFDGMLWLLIGDVVCTFVYVYGIYVCMHVCMVAF